MRNRLSRTSFSLIQTLGIIALSAVVSVGFITTLSSEYSPMPVFPKVQHKSVTIHSGFTADAQTYVDIPEMTVTIRVNRHSDVLILFSGSFSPEGDFTHISLRPYMGVITPDPGSYPLPLDSQREVYSESVFFQISNLSPGSYTIQMQIQTLGSRVTMTSGSTMSVISIPK